MKGFWVIFFLGPVILACNRTISPATGQAAESSAFNAINSPEQAVSLADICGKFQELTFKVRVRAPKLRFAANRQYIQVPNPCSWSMVNP